MKKITNILFSLIFTVSAVACNSTQSNNNLSSEQDSLETKKVEVYYFHGTRRCATCLAVSSVTKDLIESKFGDNSNVKFIEINIDEEENAELVEKFQVTGSGLYVYNGKGIENLTAMAFQYARTKPDKLKNKLIELINKNL
jgi:hypothetical protein